MEHNESFGAWVAVALLVVSLFVVSGLYDQYSGPTAQEIADLVVIEPVVIDSNPDNALLDRLCELTEGCEHYELDDSEANPVILEVADDAEDFREALADLVGLDEEYLVIASLSLRDIQVRSYTDDDFDDENYDVKLFYKVKYRDSDDDDLEYVYLLVESKLDEGEYDDLRVSEVSRSFEF